MRAVLDTNVIVSAVLIRRGNERRILDAWRGGAFDLILSPPLLDELGRVLSYPRIRDARWMTDAEVVLEVLAAGDDRVEAPRFRRRMTHQNEAYALLLSEDLPVQDCKMTHRIVHSKRFCFRGLVLSGVPDPDELHLEMEEEGKP